jgi:glycosyltransferase involved in cell wall biosynthesis
MCNLSVIMPVHNCQDYIFDSVQSILNQSFSNFELIIIDDCSSDNTATILNLFSDSRIKLFRNDIKKGTCFSLNLGIHNCSDGSDYVAIMHGDDISTFDRFYKQIKYFENNILVDIVGSQYKQIDFNGFFISNKSNLPLDHDIIKYSFYFENCICHPSVMFRKRVFREIKYSKNLIVCEDYDLWIRCILNNFIFANLNDVCLFYRIHSAQASSQKSFLEKKIFSKLNNEYIFSFSELEQRIILSVKKFDFNSLFKIFEIIKDSALDQKLKFFLFDKLLLELFLKKKYLTKQSFFLNLFKFFYFSGSKYFFKKIKQYIET